MCAHWPKKSMQARIFTCTAVKAMNTSFFKKKSFITFIHNYLFSIVNRWCCGWTHHHFLVRCHFVLYNLTRYVQSVMRCNSLWTKLNKSRVWFEIIMLIVVYSIFRKLSNLRVRWPSPARIFQERWLPSISRSRCNIPSTCTLQDIRIYILLHTHVITIMEKYTVLFLLYVLHLDIFQTFQMTNLHIVDVQINW